jgi:ABC-2 type transport system permease protein
MNLFFMRLRGFLKKESLQIMRDPSSIALALVMPLVLLFIFGYGVNLDAEHIPVAVVSSSSGNIERDLVSRFDLSSNFEVIRVMNMEQAEEMIQARGVDAIIQLQPDFSARLSGGSGNGRMQSPVQLILNGIDANRARLIEGYVRNIVAKWAESRQAQGEIAASPLVTISQRIWFNEGAESRNFMVPGLITLIMTLIGILLTALVVAREWERGTMEAMLVTPLRRIDILLGKIIPYYVLGMLGMGMSVLVAVLFFHVPFRGSVMALLLLSSLFMLASLGFGLFLSAAIRIQFVAAQISIVAGFLPAFFLSGLIFDIESTPVFIQIVSHIVPAKYFVTISHTLFMAGDIWDVLLPNGLVLAGMSLFFLSMAYKKISKRLEK